jgi:glycosyltransferase involved in cell wall biosynthesis
MNSGHGQNAVRILCISPLFAPAANAEAFCASKMVKAIQDCGSSVVVLSCASMTPNFRSDQSRIWDEVLRVTHDVPQLPRKKTWHSAVAAVRFHTRYYARWVGRVVDMAEALHRANSFDIVYSRSLPVIAHIAGFWCARKLNLPWVANMNDPWEGSGPLFGHRPLPLFERVFYLRWLRRTLLNADFVTYPCKELHQFHIEIAKIPHNAEIIPHVGCYVPDPLPSEGFRLVHAGVLGGGEWTGRPTSALLVGFKAFLDSLPARDSATVLVLVGPKDEETCRLASEFGIDQHVVYAGAVSYEESLKYIASASACVLVEGIMSKGIYLPSKLADYLAADKPVLALSPREGAVAALARNGELTRIDHDPHAVKCAISELYARHKNGRLGTVKTQRSLSSQFEGTNVASRFLGACRQAIRVDPCSALN